MGAWKFSKFDSNSHKHELNFQAADGYSAIDVLWKNSSNEK